MSEYRLSRDDWNMLDELLGKHGFGGYYDLIETLKMVAGNLGVSNTGLDIGDPDHKWTLHEIVTVLSLWSNTLSHTAGFIGVAELAAKKGIHNG